MIRENYSLPKLISLRCIHSMLKLCDKRYAENPKYIFDCRGWSEKEIFRSTKQFIQCKQYQCDVSDDQLKIYDK